MPPTITLSDGFTSTTYYLVNSTGAPVAGGASTAAATTPFAFREHWAPRAAVPETIYGGGPPFRSGASLRYRELPNVMEALPIRVVGSTHINAVSRLQDLKRLLKRATRRTPAQLSFQPEGSSVLATADVYSGYIQEEITRQTGLTPAEGGTTIDATIYLERSPYFGSASGQGETLLNAVTFTNTGNLSGNQQLLSDGSGDFILDGQPLNIKILPANTSGNNVTRLFAATCISNPVYSTTGAGALSTTSTSGLSVALANFDLTLALTAPGIKPRILSRLQTTANMEVWITVQFPNTNALPIYTSPRFTFSAGATIIDFGTFSTAMLQRLVGLGAPIVNVTMFYRSIDGSNQTLTLSSTEYLLYYDFCQIDPNPALSANGTKFFMLSRFDESTSSPVPSVLPRPAARAYTFSGTTWEGTHPARGVIPEYYDTCVLWLEWLDNLLLHTTTRTATVTVTHAPLWHTLRGND